MIVKMVRKCGVISRYCQQKLKH